MSPPQKQLGSPKEEFIGASWEMTNIFFNNLQSTTVCPSLEAETDEYRMGRCESRTGRIKTKQSMLDGVNSQKRLYLCQPPVSSLNHMNLTKKETYSWDHCGSSGDQFDHLPPFMTCISHLYRIKHLEKCDWLWPQFPPWLEGVRELFVSLCLKCLIMRQYNE